MPLTQIKQMAEHALIQDNAKPMEDMEMVAMLLKDREGVIAQFKKVLADLGEEDPATNTMLEEMLEAHEKQAWMLRSHLG
jgi:DNA-binding ferritin-like protein